MPYKIIKRDFINDVAFWDSLGEDKKEIIFMELESVITEFDLKYDVHKCEGFIIYKYSTLVKAIPLLRRGVLVRNDIPLVEVLKKLVPERTFVVSASAKGLHIDFINETY